MDNEFLLIDRLDIIKKVVEKNGVDNFYLSFSLDLQEQLKIMSELLPQEKKQCELIWEPVYQEYRRLNYRLKRDEEITIFD